MRSPSYPTVRPEPLPRCPAPRGTALCPSGASSCPVGSVGCPEVHPVSTNQVEASLRSRTPEVDQLVEELSGVVDPPRPSIRELYGRTLRYWLTVTLVDSGGVVTVAALCEALEADGCGVAGRTSKVVSDSLRWEVRRGRVIRVGRGRYVARRFPRQTLAWIRGRLAQLLGREPVPVRSWPVEHWRVGWSSIERGHELAEARRARSKRCRDARYEEFVRRRRAARTSSATAEPST